MRRRPSFRTAERASAFATAYESELARWPLKVTSQNLTGQFGSTRVNVCGVPGGPPLVLLHSHRATSTVWFANVGALGQVFRVYAVDQMGDAGMSVSGDRPIRNREELVTWLDGLLDRLAIDAAALCGHSYGAWLALSYALHAPLRVSKLALIDPTECFAGLSFSYRLRATPLFVSPNADRARRFIDWERGEIPLDANSAALTCLATGDFRDPKLVLPRRPKLSAFRSLTVPTLLLLAENSRAHDVTRVRTTAAGLIPDLAVSMLPGASHHSLPATNPGLLNDALLGFLS